MKVLCDREQLREGLAIVNNVIPLKSPRPAVENVCLVATDDKLELVGTDLEVAVRYAIDQVDIKEPGTTLIPARVASDFVRDLSGETISIETSGEHCLISSGADSCELVTVDPDEFPVVARFDQEGALPMRGGDFARLVSRTAFAAAREAGRYAMHGILTEIEDDTVRMVATDGRRLALALSSLADGKQPFTGQRRAIVPTKGMQLFCRVISSPNETILLQFEDNQVGLRTERAEIFARIIEGEFPRYSAVIPAAAENFVEADAELLSRKLRLVANVTTGDTRAIRLSLSKGQMEIFARSTGYGEAHAQLDADYKGPEATIAFNPDYVLDGLKACENPVVRLEFNERTSPGKFTLGESYTYIVMPITVDA